MNERHPRNIMVEPFAALAGVPVGTCVEEARELSNRQRRLVESVSNLPEPWPTTRPQRGEGEALSRHLQALRQRLDWLVDLEHRHGEEQAGLHHNRAQRNALIFALQQFAELAGAEVVKPTAANKPRENYDPEWIAGIERQVEDAIAHGFTTTREREPGVLHHQRDDVAPLRVPISVWFGVRWHGRAKQEA